MMKIYHEAYTYLWSMSVRLILNRSIPHPWLNLCSYSSVSVCPVCLQVLVRWCCRYKILGTPWEAGPWVPMIIVIRGPRHITVWDPWQNHICACVRMVVPRPLLGSRFSDDGATQLLSEKVYKSRLLWSYSLIVQVSDLRWILLQTPVEIFNSEKTTVEYTNNQVR